MSLDQNKANRSLLKKVVIAYQDKRLLVKIKSRVIFSFQRLLITIESKVLHSYQGAKYLINDPTSDLIKIHCPEYIAPSKDDEEMETVHRIFTSFKKMKKDQLQVSDLYKPSSMWQSFLDDNYSSLTIGMQNNDIDQFHFFLVNFGTWKAYTAIEANTLIRDHMSSYTRRRYLKNDIFNKYFEIWKWFYDERKSISCLSYPMYGNQAGCYIDNTFVGLGSFFNEIYGTILSGIVSDVDRPVIADLGAGYGKLAYFTLRNIDDFSFIDFDLPETLCLAAYYLMKVWPDKNVLLYGEENYSPECHGKFDLIFMPSYEIEKAGKSSIDLFINKNSLGEMSRDSVNNYIEYISRSTNYFFHMNHELYPNVYSDNSRGLLGYEYPVPMDGFKLILRYPEMGYMLHRGHIDFNMDIFMYLYERRSLRSPTNG